MEAKLQERDSGQTSSKPDYPGEIPSSEVEIEVGEDYIEVYDASAHGKKLGRIAYTRSSAFYVTETGIRELRQDQVPEGEVSTESLRKKLDGEEVPLNELIQK